MFIKKFCFYFFRLISHNNFQDDLEKGLQWLIEVQSEMECEVPLKLDPQNVQEEIKKVQVSLIPKKLRKMKTYILFSVSS